MSQVLVVAQEESEIKALEKIYDSVNLSCEVVSELGAAINRISVEPPTLVVAEIPSDISALSNLKAVLNSRASATPYLVILKKGEMPVAVEAMRSGAYDCLLPPLDRLSVLAASKRAVGRHRRTLFSEKVTPPQRRALWPYAASLALICLILFVMGLRSGPPPSSMSLGSAHLVGIQWRGRQLLVGDWFDSTVVKYAAKKGFRKKSRGLDTVHIQQMRDSQPILVCDTGDLLISIGSDLKIRSHHWSIGLPTLQAQGTPGPSPTGLAWDGSHVWTTDSQTGFLYRHGENLRVLDSEKSILPNPVGLACEEGHLWVFGGTPLQAAKWERYGEGYVWKGPYIVPRVLPQGVVPSGLAVGFERLWVVSGGDPQMRSISMEEMIKGKNRWKTQPKDKSA